MACWVLGAAWGLLAGLPLARRAARDGARAQLRVLAPGTATDRPIRLEIPGPIGRVARDLRARRARRRADEELERELPVVLDLLGVALGAGYTPALALDVAARWAPPAVKEPLAAAVASLGWGAGFVGALDDLARSAPPFVPLASALADSARLGAPAGGALARLAASARADARRRAETSARTLPVRLLFPLVFLVLPAFGLLTVVPTLLAGLPT